MKAFFDTSVLVPVFYGDHQHHGPSMECLLRFAKKQACCGAHSLAEIYSSLTRMPGTHRISGEQAMLFLSDVRERLTVVSLDEHEYFQAISLAAAAGVVGGTIYDALLVHCALKAKAEILYTWNVKHYGQFGSEAAKRVRTP
ncbi:MAG TPA: PIN domain-containing protein [Bryobacteraceae bacterium]|nr:PIN domain-containing protein [Bryobacteraceae bacterium]